MTNRHAGYIVSLADDIREDDAEPILQAIGMIAGVLSVIPVPADPLSEVIARQRCNSDWVDGLRGLIAARLAD